MAHPQRIETTASQIPILVGDDLDLSFAQIEKRASAPAAAKDAACPDLSRTVRRVPLQREQVKVFAGHPRPQPLRRAVEEHLRRLSHELRPTILDDLGLVPALDWLIEGVSTRSGLQITLIDSISGRLPRPIETALYRSVQEALTNIIKHACATLAKVELRQDNASIRCSISDDGIGFDTTDSLARRGGCGLGLSGIRERLYPLRGTLKINSSPGHGTDLIISAPLQDSEVQAIPKKVSGLVASQPHPIDVPIDAKGFH